MSKIFHITDRFGTLAVGFFVAFGILFLVEKILSNWHTEPIPSWLTVLWHVGNVVAFVVAGYTTVLIAPFLTASARPFLYSVVLGAVFLLMNLFVIVSPLRSDPIFGLLITGATRFASCCVGGWLRILQLKLKGQKGAA